MSPSVYIGGICGAFMTGVARIAQQSGYRVGGCDTGCYPPMSDQLANAGITFDKEYQLPKEEWQSYIVGNALSRGNPLVESLLEKRLPYCSGPQWLYQEVLHKRKTLCVAGTHGKTTTSSILAWILQYADIESGFLIGGTPANFNVSSRLGDSDFFVIEGDEYDTAFFDKRSKFIHYHPHIAILNNLEFDHADIFPDLEAIKTQFHHLVRIVPRNGLLVVRSDDEALQSVLKMGYWCGVQTFGFYDESTDWQVRPLSNGMFEILRANKLLGVAQWDMLGEHNMLNALSAIAVAINIGIPPKTAIQSLTEFKGVSRRLQVAGCYRDIVVYDDFAHHPTEIRASIEALKKHHKNRVIAVIEPRSNSMTAGCHNDALVSAVAHADQVFFYEPQTLTWSIDELFAENRNNIAGVYRDTEQLVQAIHKSLQPNDAVLVMSNGAFDNLCGRLGQLLESE